MKIQYKLTIAGTLLVLGIIMLIIHYNPTPNLNNLLNNTIKLK